VRHVSNEPLASLATGRRAQQRFDQEPALSIGDPFLLDVSSVLTPPGRMWPIS
jgi:hypothetical protein